MTPQTDRYPVIPWLRKLNLSPSEMDNMTLRFGWLMAYAFEHRTIPIPMEAYTVAMSTGIFSSLDDWKRTCFLFMQWICEGEDIK